MVSKNITKPVIPKRDIQTAWRKLPEDEFFLNTCAEEMGLNQSAVIRVAIRYLAFNQGYVLREYQHLLLCLDMLLRHAKGEKFQNLEKWLSKSEKLLKRNKEKLFSFSDDTQEAEMAVWLSETLSRKRMRQKRWPTSRPRPQR